MPLRTLKVFKYFTTLDVADVADDDCFRVRTSVDVQRRVGA